MKRKISAVILTAAIVFVCLSFTACGGVTYSETYEGTVSAQSYETKETAAAAFIEEEIYAESTPVTFAGYEKLADLTEEEVAALTIPETEKENIVSVEKGRALYYYAPAEAPQAHTAKDTAEPLSKSVYMLDVGDSYKYYDPAQISGETISKSYYNSVFNLENYKNCTMKAKISVNISGSADGYSVRFKTTMDYNCKITEQGIAMDFTVGVSANGFSTKETFKFYILETGGTITAAINYDGQWQVADLSDLDLDISGIEDMYTNFLPEADYSFFEKTNNGFKFKQEKFNQIAQEILEENFVEGIDFDFNSEYLVSEGKLYKATASCTLNGSLDSANIKTTTAVECTYTDYGTTSINIPDEVKTLTAA